MNLTYSIPTLQMNVSPGITWVSSYLSCRPLQIYRKTGAHSNITECVNDCKPNRVDKKYKLLGKRETGELIPLSCDINSVNPITHKTGNIISFSGRSSIRSALNNTSSIYPSAKPYFSNYASYLKGRGNTYLDHSKFNITNPIDTSFCQTNSEKTEKKVEPVKTVEISNEAQTEVTNYINSLSKHETQTLEIAKSHLGSSFTITKSIGFLEWKSKQKQ